MTRVDISEALKKRDNGCVLSQCEQDAVNRADEIDSFIGSHVFFAEHNQLITTALSEVLTRLPEDACEAICVDAFIVFPEKNANHVVRLFRDAFPAAFSLVVLADYLNRKDMATVVGVLAHELAHVYLAHNGGSPEIESAADALAIQWGFQAEITASRSPDTASQVEPSRRTLTS